MTRFFSIVLLCWMALPTIHAQTKKEFWDNGNTKSQGSFVGNLKTGRWKYYYPNGQLEAEGDYTAKKTDNPIEVVKKSRQSAIDDSYSARNGVWTFYHENGQVKGKATYNTGCPTGTVERWHNNGQKAETSEYLECKALGNRKLWDREGKLYFETKVEAPGQYTEIEWYANGQAKSEIPYKDGQQYGKVKRWYPNGQREEEVMMKNTRVHGAYRSWYENGNKQREFFSINNIMSGEYREWNERGVLLVELVEEPETRSIRVKNFWDNGQVKFQGQANLPASQSIHQWMQSRQGEWTYFSQDGRPTKKETYENGRLVNTIMQ